MSDMCNEGAQPGVSSSLVAPSAPSGPKTSAELRSLTREQVSNWAIAMCEFDDEDATKLIEQKIDGIALCLMTEETLSKGAGIPFGSAVKLMAKFNALKALLDAEPGPQRRVQY